MQAPPPALAIRLLGGVEVRVQGEPLPRLRSRQGLRLLALLVLRAPRELERRYLAGQLWPDTPEDDGLALLRRTLTDLRRALGPEAERLHSPSRHTLQLRLESGLWLDTLALESNLARENADLAEARALYRGPLLEGFHDDWVLGERERYQLLFLTSLERRAAQLPPSEATVLLRHALSLDPLRESSVRALLEALATQGDTAGLTATFRQFCRTLRRTLDTEPDEATHQLYRRLLRTSKLRTNVPPSEPPPRSALASALPRPLTLFFGRAEESRRLIRFLESPQHRLLTLTGPGGTGKTRLATELAHRTAPHFPGGVFFLSLVEQSEPAQVPGALAQLLQLPASPESTLHTRLIQALTGQGKRVLLVLDNLEQLLAHPEAPRLRQLVTELLGACPSLTCLATSRIPLRLSGEREFPLPPLSLPTSDTPLTELSRFASVALFCDRVQSLRPEWELTEQNAPLVRDLCQRLEGSPLALELAAGSLRVLTLTQLLSRLERRLELLADRHHDIPERHRSLRAAIESSFRLLSDDHQRFFASLSVFRGGCDLAAAEAVCRGTDPLEALATLEEHSLLQLSPAGEGRYLLLETVREFAAERLEELGLREATERYHAEHFTRLAAAASEGLLTPEQARWHAVMDQDDENIRAALDNLALHPTEENTAHFLQLIALLSRYWERRSHFREAYQRCQQGLQLHGERPPTDLSARALLRMGVHCWRFGELEPSRAYTEQALAYFATTGNLAAQCDALQHLGILTRQAGDSNGALQLFEEGLTLARRANDLNREASLLGNLGWVASHSDELDKAVLYYEAQLALRRELGDLGRIARSLGHLGSVALRAQDFATAERYYTESLALNQTFKNEFSVATDLLALAEIACAREDWEHAHRLSEEAQAIKSRLGVDDDDDEKRVLERISQGRSRMLSP